MQESFFLQNDALQAGGEGGKRVDSHEHWQATDDDGHEELQAGGTQATTVTKIGKPGDPTVTTVTKSGKPRPHTR